MTFSLQNMTPTQYEEIYKRYDHLFSAICAPQKKWDAAWKQRNWFVDPDTDSRFMYIAKYLPIGGDPAFLLLYKGRPLILRIYDGGPVSVRRFVVPEDLLPELEAIRQTIRDAYAVYDEIGGPGQAASMQFE